jgi:hypothetical protein
MRARQLLLKILQHDHVISHVKRADALLNAVQALVTGASLSLSCLGRALNPHGSDKHGIKSIDELMGNQHLHHERLGVYRALAHRVLCGVHRLIVQVDWSDSGRHDVRILRATIALPGRSFVLWEQVYTEQQYNSSAAHRAFMNELHSVLPSWCAHVLVITDAGFRAPWFRLVESFGWHWLSRVRRTPKVCCDGHWTSVGELYARATGRAQALGHVLLNKSNSLPAQMFLSRAPRPKRHGPRRNAEHYRAAKSHREPWLLATSMGWSCTAAQVTKLYDTRMQIEQSFRDCKSPRFGYGLRYSNSKKPQRVAVLLLIAALATFAQWLAGLVAEAQDWSRLFQANTEKKRRVLSVVFIGGRMFNSKRFQITQAMLNQALHDLSKLVIQVPECARF